MKLVPRADNAEWTSPQQVVSLARHYGGLLRHSVTVIDPRGESHRINAAPPWQQTHRSPLAKREAYTAYCRELFDFAPIELDLPAAGLRGVAYVLPTAVSPAQRAGHRVHLKGMLLTDQAPELLPEWAFFVRCVVDTTSLRPTASRESLRRWLGRQFRAASGDLPRRRCRGLWRRQHHGADDHPRLPAEHRRLTATPPSHPSPTRVAGWRIHDSDRYPSPDSVGHGLGAV